MTGYLQADGLPEDIPTPEAWLCEEADKRRASFAPAQDLAKWVRAHWIDKTGQFYNPTHSHLRFATIGFLWTNGLDKRQGNITAGQAELLRPPKTWSDATRHMLLRSFFGIVPDFLITLYAPHFDDCASRGRFDACCALIEHELHHCAQALTKFNEPKFTKDGDPVWAMRGHDVEEFVGVVERWPAVACAGKTALLIEAAKKAPAFSADVARNICCGCGSAL